MTQPYAPRRLSRSTDLMLNGLRCHVRLWGEAGAPPIVLLHGSRDASATFQFMVDCFARDRLFIAPDLRGHGASGRNPQGYWFQDYLRDVDALFEALSLERAPLVGHSLGGNIACVYGALRPERVTRLVSLDGFGLRDADPAGTPDHLRRWLDAWRAPRSERAYPGVAAMADRLMKSNPYLPRDKALFLAQNVSQPVAGGHAWAFDPLHRLPFASLHRYAEWEACVRRVAAPTLWLAAERRASFMGTPAELTRRAALVADMRFETIPDAGHNMHHDAPAVVAQRVEAFLDAA